MLTRPVALVVLAYASVASGQAPEPLLGAPTAFVLGAVRGEYEMQADGVATNPQGATLILRAISASPSRPAAVTSTLGTDALRGRRLTLVGELLTREVTEGASLWMRVDEGATMLFLENGMDRPQQGTGDWTRREVALPIPDTATRVAFGLLLQGPGEARVRGLRLIQAVRRAPDTAQVREVQAFVDAAIHVTRTHALRASAVDWPATEPAIRALAADARTTTEAYPAVRYLLSRLGDGHSFLMSPARTTQSQRGDITNPPVVVNVSTPGVGYIAVPSYGGVNAERMRADAALMHEALARVAANARCGFIVDLRANGGGNMWPMLAGLAPLLGRAPVGQFDGPAGRAQPWRPTAILTAGLPPELADLETRRVAVLTGPRTASSGEAVVVAFRGRPNTRSFGRATAGLSTANSSYPLPDGSTLLLTTAVFVDRLGQRYGHAISPDQVVEEVATQDAPHVAAAQWLRESAECR